MTSLSRREAVSAMGAAAIAASGLLSCRPDQVDRAARHAAANPGTDFDARFLTPHEVATVAVLGDLIIPADDRSGAASDAGAPAFIDFVLAEEMTEPTLVRGGLAWLDRECQSRFRRRFVECDDTQRAGVLDDIAWPARAKPEHSQGVAFFNRFRDLIATAFWSSRIGVEDIGYMGNHPVLEWKGCPEPQLRKLGLM